MNIIVYSGFAYALTIILSFLVIGIVVLTDRLIQKNDKKHGKEE